MAAGHVRSFGTAAGQRIDQAFERVLGLEGTLTEKIDQLGKITFQKLRAYLPLIPGLAIPACIMWDTMTDKDAWPVKIPYVPLFFLSVGLCAGYNSMVEDLARLGARGRVAVDGLEGALVS